MVKLLAYRVAPLALRPLAILIEGMLPGKPALLILSLPIAMMALMLSSVPVHLEFYKAREGEIGLNKKSREYSAGLGWIFVFSLLVLFVILNLPFLGFAMSFVAIVCLTFIIEKLSDESSRALEFRKNYFGWFLVQVQRSSWVFVPLVIAFWNGSYEMAYLIFASIAACISAVIFTRVTGVGPSLGVSGLRAIKHNLVYFFGSFLPASYRQLPRIIIAKMYPEQAHAFLALAQLGQGVGILFKVHFQIPYRKIIARKPFLFQKLMAPTMMKVLMVSFSVVVIYGVKPVFIDISGLAEIYQMAFFAPVVFAEAVLFAVLSAYLGYVQWLGKRVLALYFYVFSMMIVAVTIFVLSAIDYVGLVNLAGIPFATMLVGLLWILIAKWLFFRPSEKQEEAA